MTSRSYSESNGNVLPGDGDCWYNRNDSYPSCTVRSSAMAPAMVPSSGVGGIVGPAYLRDAAHDSGGTTTTTAPNITITADDNNETRSYSLFKVPVREREGTLGKQCGNNFHEKVSGFMPVEKVSSGTAAAAMGGEESSSSSPPSSEDDREMKTDEKYAIKEQEQDDETLAALALTSIGSRCVPPPVPGGYGTQWAQPKHFEQTTKFAGRGGVQMPVIGEDDVNAQYAAPRHHFMEGENYDYYSGRYRSAVGSSNSSCSSNEEAKMYAQGRVGVGGQWRPRLPRNGLPIDINGVGAGAFPSAGAKSPPPGSVDFKNHYPDGVHQESKSQDEEEDEDTPARKPRKKYFPDVKEYVVPTTRDVLFGRGEYTNRHAGNREFHKRKYEFRVEYESASKSEKKIYAQALVDTVHSWGGRFLEKDEKGWYPVHNVKARYKASQALREAKLDKEQRFLKRIKYKYKYKMGSDGKSDADADTDADADASATASTSSSAVS